MRSARTNHVVQLLQDPGLSVQEDSSGSDTAPCPPATQQLKLFMYHRALYAAGDWESGGEGTQRSGTSASLHRIRVQAGSNHLASGSHVATHMWQSNQPLSPRARARRARTRAVSLALHGFQSASQRHASHRTRTVSERSSQASQGGPRPPKKLRQRGLRPPPSS